MRERERKRERGREREEKDLTHTFRSRPNLKRMLSTIKIER